MVDILVFATFLVAGDCQVSLDAVQHYESEILQSQQLGQFQQLQKSLSCLLVNQNRLTGTEKFLANSFINTLLGRPLPGNIKKDERYERTLKWLSAGLMRDSVKVSHSFLNMISLSRMSDLEPFCLNSKYDSCKVFLPENSEIINASPLLGAIMVLQLKKAQSQFPQQYAEEIRNQLTKLKGTPNLNTLIKKVLDEVLEQSVPLSLV